MIYLLGGPPRVGKSLVAAAIQNKLALSVISTDTLAAVLTSVLSPEATPDLYVFDRFHEMPIAEQTEFIRQDPAGFMDYVRRESVVVWNAVEAFMKREQEEGRHVLIEALLCCLSWCAR